MGVEGIRKVRKPAVAGLFYPDDPAELHAAVSGYLSAASGKGIDGEKRPKALIVPHAGYVYSGPVAASAYARIRDIANSITRVVLFGPAHRMPFEGLALPGSTVSRRRLARYRWIWRRSNGSSTCRRFAVCHRRTMASTASKCISRFSRPCSEIFPWYRSSLVPPQATRLPK